MDIKLEPDPGRTSVTIGDEFQRTNEIRFTIVLTGNERVRLTLQIPAGADGLLREREDGNAIVVTTPGTEPAPKRDLPKLEWKLGDKEGVAVTGSTKISVSISNIKCRANAGETKPNLTISDGSKPYPLAITKAPPTKEPENPILYFIAAPTFLKAPGPVELTWKVFGQQQVTLETPDGASYTNPPNPFPVPLQQKTGPYTLRVGERPPSQVTVNVRSAGWHRLDPLDKAGFPSVIFDPGDAKTQYLYGIFVRPKATAALCRSQDGMTGWNITNEDVPEGMESSPGLLLQNRLWLIGGSAADPDRKCSEIWYIDLNDISGRWKKAGANGCMRLIGAEAFEKRMGHACVIVSENTFWVLGGLGRYECLNDVWSFTITGDNLTGSRLLKSSPDPERWKARCMFSAVKRGADIWICGGVDSPNGNPLGDIWTTGLEKQEWVKRKGKQVIADAIGTGAACLGRKLVAIFTTRKGQETKEFKSKKSELSRATLDGDDWNTTELLEEEFKRPDWTDDAHSITTVSFLDQLYLRYLNWDALHAADKDPAPLPDAPLYVYLPPLPPK